MSISLTHDKVFDLTTSNTFTFTASPAPWNSVTRANVSPYKWASTLRI